MKTTHSARHVAIPGQTGVGVVAIPMAFLDKGRRDVLTLALEAKPLPHVSLLDEPVSRGPVRTPWAW